METEGSRAGANLFSMRPTVNGKNKEVNCDNSDNSEKKHSPHEKTYFIVPARGAGQDPFSLRTRIVSKSCGSPRWFLRSDPGVF